MEGFGVIMARTIQTIVAVMHDKDKFLILKKKGTWEGWQFVQGEKEKDEEWEAAARREVKEETGLDCISAAKTDIKAEYWFRWEGELVHKFLTFFLVQADSNAEVKISEEHSDYKWVDYETALKEIKFNKEQFRKAYEEIRKIK